MSLRSYLLSVTAALALTGGLVACTIPGTNTQFTPTMAVADADTLIAGAEAILPSLTTLSADQKTKLETDLSNASGLVQALATSTSATQAQPVVQQIEADVNAVLEAAAAIPGLPPAVTVAIQAANVLLPVIEAEVGVLTAGLPTGTMSPDTARSTLRTFSVTKH